MTLIFSIANMASHVGKSITAVNVGASLALLGHKTVLIDCDINGTATGMIKRGTTHSRQPLYDFLGGGRRAHLSSCETVIPGLTLIPAGDPVAPVNAEGLKFPPWENPFEIGLDQFRGIADVVIFDLPAKLDFISVTALAASNGVILPVADMDVNMPLVAKTLTVIRQINETMYSDIKIWGVLRTRVDQNLIYSNNIPESFPASWKKILIPAVIPEDSVFGQSIKNQIPVCLEDLMHPGAIGYFQAAEYIKDKFISI